MLTPTLLDRSIPTTVAAATETIHSGSSAVQDSVVPGTIRPATVAHLRGRVLGVPAQDRSQPAPLSRARVSILGRPEFGGTWSRADGVFDLVINGGGAFVVSFEAPGYLAVQRRLEVPAQRQLQVPDVVLVAAEVGQLVSFPNAAPVVVVGPVVRDTADGPARRHFLYLPPGTEIRLLWRNCGCFSE